MHGPGRIGMDADKGLGDCPAGEGPDLPGGLPPGDADPKGLDDEAGDDDAGQEQQDDGVVGGVVRFALVPQTLRLLQVATVDGHERPDQDCESEEIHEEREDQVKLAGQEGDPQRFGHVEFRGVKGRAEDQDRKPEKDQSMHDAGIKILEGLDLKQAVPEQQLDPLVPVVPPDFRLPDGGPHLPAPVDAVGHDPERHEGEHEQERFKMLGIPEDFPSFIADRKM